MTSLGQGRGVPDNEVWVYRAFVAGVIAVTFLQKVCLPGNLEIAFPILVALILGLFAIGAARLNVVRVLLYTVFALLVVVSQMLSGVGFSSGSLIMALLIYIPFCVECHVSEKTYDRCIEYYQNVIVVISVIVLVQHAIQFTLGAAYWPNLNEVIPQSFQFQSYAYMRSIAWGSPYYKPNAIFFLEVSIVSQFVALAFIIEMRKLQRAWRLGLYLVALAATMGGTGLLLVALTSPFLVRRMSPRRAIAVIGVILVGGIAAFQIGLVDNVLSRFDEFGQSGRSANDRFVMPLDRLVEFARTGGEALYTGIGAGLLPAANREVWWPITKVSVEYGFAAALALHVLLLYALFRGAQDRAISFALLAMYSIMNGSFILPYVTVLCVLLATMLRVAEDGRAPQVAFVAREITPKNRSWGLKQRSGGWRPGSAAP